jgi:hypothetical protein
MKGMIMRGASGGLLLALLAVTADASAQERWNWIVAPYLGAAGVDLHPCKTRTGVHL